MEATNRTSFLGGIAICMLGAICFSTKAIFVKVAFRDTPVDAVTLLALRMLFSMPFFIASAWYSSRKKDNLRFTRRQWTGVALVGCLGYYVSSLLDFLGLQYVSAGIERLILFVYPTMVLLMSAALFRVRISPKQWMAVGITYAGLMLAFTGEARFQADSRFFLGATLVFICAITYAMYIVGSGRLIPGIGASKFNSYAMSFAGVAVIIHYLIVSGFSLPEQPSIVYGYSLAMAVVSTVIPSYLIAEGIRRVGSDNAAIVGSIGPVSTIVQAYFVLGEPFHLLQIGGTILILGGILIISRNKQAPSAV